MKELIRRAKPLLESDRIPNEERESLDADLKKFAFLVEVQEFIIQQINRAHAARSERA